VALLTSATHWCELRGLKPRTGNKLSRETPHLTYATESAREHRRPEEQSNSPQGCGTLSRRQRVTVTELVGWGYVRWESGLGWYLEQKRGRVVHVTILYRPSWTRSAMSSGIPSLRPKTGKSKGSHNGECVLMKLCWHVVVSLLGQGAVAKKDVRAPLANGAGRPSRSRSPARSQHSRRRARTVRLGRRQLPGSTTWGSTRTTAHLAQ
jgi:hypothetical protein